MAGFNTQTAVPPGGAGRPARPSSALTAGSALDAGASFAFPGSPSPFAPKPLEGDFNLQNPGAGESFYADTQGQYTQPSFSEQVFSQNRGQLGTQGTGEQNAYLQAQYMNQPGEASDWYNANQNTANRGGAATQRGQGSGNMAAQVFNQWNSSSPADMSSYYDNAGRQALERINQNAAARGTYGSSAALAEGSESLTNLAADRAKAEADYGLRRFQLGGELGQGAEQSQLGWNQAQREWFDSGSQASTAADDAELARYISGARTGLEADEAGRERVDMASDLASQGDQAWMNRLQLGQNAASGAQGDREARIKQMYDAVFGVGNAVGGAAATAYGGMTDDAANLLTSANNASMGAPSTALQYDTYEANQHRQEMSDWMEMIKKFGGGGGLPTGGGAGP